MPRRNFYLLIGLSIASLLCYWEGVGQRSRYGRMFRTFTHVMQEIEENYVEPVDERELFEGALSGMAGRLDEYSSYINPQAFRELQEDLGKSFGGIGVQVTLDNETKQLTVMSPVVGTPAYEAGILAGDKIIKINDQTTEGFSLQDAVSLIRGEPGEEVRLTLLREGMAEPREYRLERAAIHVDTVLGDTRDAKDRWNFFIEDEAGIGYIRVTAFSEQTAAELKETLAWLAQRHMRGLILDLRNNPGGLLRSAVEISDLFIDGGKIVTTRGRDGKVLDAYEASADGSYLGFPMVVLVNRNSASASEIVAACLQDHHRALIVGERTWGKGSVQNIIGLEEGKSALRLTMASYWRPSGDNIHRGRDATEEDQWGVIPNDGFEVKLTPEQFQELLTERRQRDVLRPHQTADSDPLPDVPQKDPQLRRALEYLHDELGKAATESKAA